MKDNMMFGDALGTKLMRCVYILYHGSDFGFLKSKEWVSEIQLPALKFFSKNTTANLNFYIDFIVDAIYSGIISEEIKSLEGFSELQTSLTNYKNQLL